MKVMIIAALLLIVLSSNASAGTTLVKASEYQDVWPFPQESQGILYCKILDQQGRKAVWLDGSNHTYALNGQAMTWMIGNDLLGVGGGPVKIGRDYSKSPAGLSKLIADGLALCK